MTEIQHMKFQESAVSMEWLYFSQSKVYRLSTLEILLIIKYGLGTTFKMLVLYTLFIR